MITLKDKIRLKLVTVTFMYHLLILTLQSLYDQTYISKGKLHFNT